MSSTHSTPSRIHDTNHAHHNQYSNSSTPKNAPPPLVQRSSSENEAAQQAKTVTILSGTLGRKKEYTFVNQMDFENYLQAHNLRGVKAVKPNPSPVCLTDIRELQSGSIYGKVNASFLQKAMGLGDAGFKGVKYSIDELVPPLFNFFDELNTTIRSSILNDSAYKLSAVAGELLDGTILRIQPNWTVVIDLLIFVSMLFELHCSLAVMRDQPFNFVNLAIAGTCVAVLYFIIQKHYDWEYHDQSVAQHTIDENTKYVHRPYYHQNTDRGSARNSYSHSQHYD